MSIAIRLLTWHYDQSETRFGIHAYFYAEKRVIKLALWYKPIRVAPERNRFVNSYMRFDGEGCTSISLKSVYLKNNSILYFDVLTQQLQKPVAESEQEDEIYAL